LVEGFVGSLAGVGATVRSQEPLALFGTVGIATYIVSGILFGTHGYLLGVKRIDLLHYSLAVANLALLYSLAGDAPVPMQAK
jgi:hypothetical protein